PPRDEAIRALVRLGLPPTPVVDRTWRGAILTRNRVRAWILQAQRETIELVDIGLNLPFSGRSGFLHPDRRLDPPVYTILKRRAGRRVAAPSTARRSGRVGRRVSTATSGGWREVGQLRTQAREHFSNAADGELRDRRRRHVLRLRADAVRLVDEHV